MAYTEFHVQLIDKRTKSTIDDDSGLFNVLTAGDPSEVTIYSDPFGHVEASNPGTITNGEIQFWTNFSTTTVDLTILADSGHAVFIEGLTPSQHRVEIDVEKMQQTFVTFYSGTVACNANTDTGFKLPLGAKVKDVYVHATDTTTAGTLDVGNTTDTDGFLDGAIASVTGWKHYEVPIYTTQNTTGHYVSAVQYRGALIATLHSGNVVTACAGDFHGQFSL